MTGALAGVAGVGAEGGGVDGVLLDIDDTLVDTRSAFVAAIAAVAAVHLPHLDAAGVGDAVALWRADPNGHYRRHTRGELSAAQQRLLRAAELHERFGGPPLDEDSFPAWDAVFRQGFEDGWAAHDDALPTVGVLRARGIAVGALTNAVGDLSVRKLDRCGLSEAVPLLVTLDTLGYGKPDARVFLEACRRLGTDPARTVYVGDELDTDALAARDAGLCGVWLDRPGTRRGGVHLEDEGVAREAGVGVIDSLAGLPALLGLAEAGASGARFGAGAELG